MEKWSRYVKRTLCILLSAAMVLADAEFSVFAAEMVKENLAESTNEEHHKSSVLYWGVIGYSAYDMMFTWKACAIGTSDAIAQHYPAMSYIRKTWVDFFSTLIHGGHYTFPMVDFTIGMGENTISALNYYGLGDPFYILTVLSSQENLPYFYSVFSFLECILEALLLWHFHQNLAIQRAMLHI